MRYAPSEWRIVVENRPELRLRETVPQKATKGKSVSRLNRAADEA